MAPAELVIRHRTQLCNTMNMDASGASAEMQPLDSLLALTKDEIVEILRQQLLVSPPLSSRLVPVTVASLQGLEYMKLWNEYVEAKNAQASVTANSAWHTASVWVRSEAETAIIGSTVDTIIIATCSGWAGVLLFTGDVLLAVIVTAVVIVVITGSACNDPAGAARCLAAAAAGLLMALRPLPWPLLLHSAVCALGWLLEVGPWLLDFDTAWAILRTRGQTYFFVTMLGPPCWTLGLYVTLLLYIQRTSTQRLPLYGAHGSSNAADQWGHE
ncbi:unnamed protein product, partial [Symbiodinium microadriaticum]